MPYLNYLTESAEVERSINKTLDYMLSEGLKPCLKAPTGTGKTTLIYKRMQKEASNGALSILALPFKSIVENKRIQASEYGVYSGIAEELKDIPHSQNGLSIQTTYEGALNILKSTRYKDIKVYIDEAHVLISQSSLRNSTSELLDLDLDVISMTATPLHLEDVGFSIYEPERAIETPKINVKSLISNKSTSSIIHKVITEYKKDSVLQIRINNKDEIAKACNLAKAKDIRYVAIYTAGNEGILSVNEHSGLTQEEIKQAQKGIFSSNVDLILNTSKVDCGLDFKIEGDRPFRMIAVGNKVKQFNAMPNISDLAQAVNRMRWNDVKDADITIIGQFGDKEYKKAEDIFNSIKEDSGIISALEYLKNNRWDSTQFYKESEYRKVLADYNVNLLGAEEVNIQYKQIVLKRHASIFVRLNQFKGFEQTNEIANLYGFNLLDYCVEHDNSNTSPSAMAKAQEIMSHLEDLFHLYQGNAPIQSVWTGKVYSKANAEALILVAKAIKSNSNLGAIINRAEAKGELLKADLSSLVKTERKALSKYLQIIHNIKPVNISSNRYKTIKLNKGKESASVVGSKESQLGQVEAQDSKSFSNEEINQLLINI